MLSCTQIDKSHRLFLTTVCHLLWNWCGFSTVAYQIRLWKGFEKCSSSSVTTKGIVAWFLYSKSIKSATTVTKQMRDEGDSSILFLTHTLTPPQSSIAQWWIALSCRFLSKGPLQGSFCLMVLTSSANQMELPLRLLSLYFYECVYIYSSDFLCTLVSF